MYFCRSRHSFMTFVNLFLILIFRDSPYCCTVFVHLYLLFYCYIFLARYSYIEHMDGFRTILKLYKFRAMPTISKNVCYIRLADPLISYVANSISYQKFQKNPQIPRSLAPQHLFKIPRVTPSPRRTQFTVDIKSTNWLLSKFYLKNVIFN